MAATISDFFGSNLEQEGVDEVVILPYSPRNTASGSFSTPVGVKFSELDSLTIALGINTNNRSYDVQAIENIHLKTRLGSWTAALTYSDTVRPYTCMVEAVSDTTANWSSLGTDASDRCYPLYVIGHKRRIARVGLDELMSSMGLPNLVVNPDLNNPVNQRAFNGNWGSLAIGAYGYDQWIKTSNTHMGFVIESGKYIPNKMHTLTVNNAVVKQVMSPASGHFVVSIPFATSGVYDFYAGEFKRPWHPPKNALVDCARYYERVYLDTTGLAYSNEDCRGTVIPMLAQKRAKPTLGTVTVSVFAVSPAGNGVNLSGSLYNWVYYPTHMSAANLGNAANIATAVGGGGGTVFSFSCRETNPMLVDCAIPWSELNNKVIIAA